MNILTQQHVVGGVVVLIALAHFIWSAQIAELNSRRTLFIYPSTIRGVRVLGAFLLLMGLFAILT